MCKEILCLKCGNRLNYSMDDGACLIDPCDCAEVDVDEMQDLKRQIVELKGITAVYDLDFTVPSNMVVPSKGVI